MKKILVLMTVSALFAGQTHLMAGIHSQAGTRAASFLRIGPGARPSAMAGAYTALGGDAMSLHWNPAGLADVSSREIEATFARWIADTSYGDAAIAVPLRRGVLGLGIRYLNYGSLIRTTGLDDGGMPIQDGEFGASDAAFSLGWSAHTRVHGLPVSWGAAAKAVRLVIDRTTAFGYAVDGGIAAEVAPRTRIGLSGRNIGFMEKMDDSGQQLPAEFALGLSRALAIGRSGLLTAAIDGILPSDNTMRAVAGAEYGWRDAFFLRAGWRLNYDTDWMTAGFGLKYRTFRLDYAFAPFSVLGDTHRFTIGIPLCGPRTPQ